MDPQSPIESPPPAYQAEHDFDRKISDALERSLTIANQTPQQLSLPPGEDEWEEWDEAKFEAAAAVARASEQRRDNEQPTSSVSRQSSEKKRLARQDAWQPTHRSGEASSSTSSRSVVQSSRRLPTRPPAKERPSWYSEAQLDASASSGSSQNNSQVSSLVHHLPPEEDVPNEPLPPFAAVGPSLEGPPFEEVVRQPPRLPPASNIDSPPQSPLDSVESDSLPDPPSAPESSNQRGYVQRYRSTSPHQSPVPPMPLTTPVLLPLPRPPPMRFDPSVAYAKHRSVNLPLPEAEPVDASALYNSSVSSLFVSNQTYKRPNPVRKDSSASSGSNPPVIPAEFPTHDQLSPNSYHPMQNQASVPSSHGSYSQSLPLQSQQVVSSLYGHQFLRPAPGPPPRTPPQPHWPRPSHNAGGYRG